VTPSEAVAPAAAQDAETQAAFQQQLSAYGFYSPLELLMATNRLRYDDYQAWRQGGRATLDGALVPGSAQVRALLEGATSWARGLQLEGDIVALYGTDSHAGAELKASSDAGLDVLLRTEYRSPTDRKQPDLFLDGSEMRAQNALVDALTSRDRTAAEEARQRLANVDARHWTLDHADALIESLATPPPDDPDQALVYLHALEHRWLPSAGTLLHNGVRDFLSPLWRLVGKALEGVPFDPDNPRAHASWAYLNGLDWEGVRRSVRQIEDADTDPVLQVRMAEAAWRLRHYTEAVGRWFWLCWHAPAHFEECVGAAGFPDARLKNTWEASLDQDLDPPVATRWFPAWAMIEQPGLGRILPPCHGTSEGERAFDHLLALQRGRSDREDLDHRRALRDLHPGLLGRYLDTLGL